MFDTNHQLANKLAYLNVNLSPINPFIRDENIFIKYVLCEFFCSELIKLSAQMKYKIKLLFNIDQNNSDA